MILFLKFFKIVNLDAKDKKVDLVQYIAYLHTTAGDLPRTAQSPLFKRYLTPS
jgi:hypothetical protein